jgi:hypothetical protein
VDRVSSGLMGTETVPSIDMRRIKGTEAASLLDFVFVERCAAFAGTGGLGLEGPATGSLPAPNRSFIALTDTGRFSFSLPARGPSSDGEEGPGPEL